MGAETSSDVDAILTEAWTEDDFQEVLYKKPSGFAIIPKGTDFWDKKLHVPVGYGTGQGISASFTQGKAAKSAEVQAEFEVTVHTIYTFFGIDRLLKKRAKNGRGSVVDEVERKSRNALVALAREFGVHFYGTGVGDIGVIATSGISSATITLATAAHIRRIEKNMQLELSSDNTGVAGVRAGTPLVVSSVVRNGTTTTFTCSANITTSIPGAVQGDHIYRAGNYNSLFKGLGKYLPSTDPTGGDSLYGLDRSADPQRLAGVRTDCSGLSPREAWLLGAKDLDDASPGQADIALGNSGDIYNLTLELQSAGALTATKVPAAKIEGASFGIEFDTVEFWGPTGKLKIISDADAPSGVGHLLEKDTWEYKTAGPMIEWVEKGMTEENSDSEEWRAASDGALICHAPGNNARLAF